MSATEQASAGEGAWALRSGDGRPVLLDLFCGAGGAAKGYQMAGFRVVGVDIKPQPRYCGDEFHQADAMTVPLDGYDAIHASPPCQAYSPLNSLTGYKHTIDLVDPIRQRLLPLGVPFVIENVPGAPLYNYTVLCGTMFGLRVIRHRWFEVHPFPLMAPRSCCHSVPVAWRKVKDAFDVGAFVSVTGHRGSYVSSRAMDIDWMTGDELSQAIPPAYTHYIGEQLMRVVLAQRAEREEAQV